MKAGVEVARKLVRKLYWIGIMSIVLLASKGSWGRHEWLFVCEREVLWSPVVVIRVERSSVRLPQPGSVVVREGTVSPLHDWIGLLFKVRNA